MTWQSLARKEFKEHVRPAGKLSGTVIAAIVMSVLFGIAATIVVGLFMHTFSATYDTPLYLRVWITMLAGLGGATFSSTLIPMNLGVDAIAGERERHTLQTLLAGPLGDKEILWGKALAIVGVSMVANGIGGVAVGLTLVVLYAQHGILLALLAVPMSLLAPVLPAFVFTCFAFIFSARAKTVKDAGQKMSYVMIPMMLAPALGPALISRSPGFAIVVLAIVGALTLVLAVLVPTIAFVRFKRHRLLV